MISCWEAQHSFHEFYTLSHIGPLCLCSYVQLIFFLFLKSSISHCQLDRQYSRKGAEGFIWTFLQSISPLQFLRVIYSLWHVHWGHPCSANIWAVLVRLKHHNTVNSKGRTYQLVLQCQLVNPNTCIQVTLYTLRYVQQLHTHTYMYIYIYAYNNN